MTNNYFKFNDSLIQMARAAEEKSQGAFANFDKVASINGERVLSAFIENGVSESHFITSTGYGYGDRGREVLDNVLADIFGAEDALIRHNFASGTHTLAVALFGILRPGDTMVSITGTPYDTIHSVIGLGEEAGGSLREFGVKYEEIALTNNGEVDFDAIPERVKNAKIAYIQRSRGYSLRKSITIDEIARIVKIVKAANPRAIVMVDNCYGEFVEELEPTHVGADLIAGSLIKNPGGAIARTGGYIAGRRDLIALCANRLTCPGVGREIGCTLGMNRELYLGLFLAPEIVANALKTSEFAVRLFEDMGYVCYPSSGERRTDVIAAIKLGGEKRLTAFCEGIQAGSPIDSYFTPVASDMPGYDSKVIMAAGAFTMGASIELSADAPIREPFAVWLQGGITYPSGKVGIMLAAQRVMNVQNESEN